MSMVTGRRRRRRFQEVSVVQPARRPRRRRWWLAATALILLGLFWWLPAIVAHTLPFRWILAAATADLEGTVTVQRTSLGWFAPIVVEGIEVRDVHERPMLQAAKLASGKSLAAILLDMSHLGEFRLERPKLSVVLRDEGSNIEDVLAAYIEPSEEPPKAVGVGLKIVDGSVAVTDQNSRQTWQIEDLQLSLSTSADATGPLRLETSAAITDAEHPGRFAVGLTMRRESAGELSIEAGAVPLAMFGPLARRFAPQTRLAGRLTSKIHAQWGGAGAAGKTVVQAEAATDDVTLAMPPLGTDQVQLKQLRLACRITGQDDRVEIEQSSLDCDLGSVSVTGTLDLGDQQPGQLLASVLRQTYDIEGHVDLARLAQMLPRTLRIRKATQVTSGQVQLALSSRRSPQGMIWQGRIEASDLSAADRGRQLAWEKPISMVLSAYETPQGPVVERLKCESSFLKLHAAGTLDELAASANLDLKQLTDELGRFVDLGGLGLAGDGWAQFNWKRSAGRQFQADLELNLHDFQLALSEGQHWTEKDLMLSLSASGRTDFAADTQLQNASLQIKVGADRIDAQLTQPVLDLRGGGIWPIELTAKGQLQSWPARLRTWIAMDDHTMAGNYELAAQANGSIDGITVRRARLNAGQLRLLGPRLKVSEPNVELVLSGGWDRHPRRLQLDTAALTCSSLAIQVGHLVLAMPERGPLEMTGVVNYRGDLRQLTAWFADPNAPPTWHIAGQLSGTADVQQSAGLIHAQLDTQIDNLVFSTSSGDRLDEPQVQLVARGDYEHQAGALRLAHVEFRSGTLGVAAKGRIAQSNDQTDLDLDGRIQYDLEKLTGLLRPYIGPGVHIVGSGTSPMSYRGPLAPAEAKATADVSWQRADVYGFQIGPGDLKVTLADGILQAEPMQLAVSQGQMLLAPKVRLAPEPIELTVAPGPLATQVQIAPAMCDAALKYIAPVLAGVTSAQGSFSIELDDCRIPLGDPTQGELAGKFTIHSVRIGPGPLVQELAVLLGRASPAKLRRESIVRFQMVDGRVHHQGLELIFPDLTIRTHGSVGLDQTLAIIAEMPVPPKWIGNNVLGSALRGQTIRLPIGGTLSRPKIDRRELDQLSRRFLENAARNVIEDEVGKQLERLFGRPR